MALGALVGAYQEDAGGALRALLPLAGRTLLEYQVRCAAAAGAAPVIVLVDRIPPELNEALDRLERERLPVTAVTDPNEVASRFGAGDMVMLIADGIATPPELLATIADEPDAAIATVPDDPEHEEFERIDGVSRWAGVALVDPQTLGSTVAMLGDWDLQSTLLRRSLQAGARLVPIHSDGGQPVLADSAGALGALDRQLIVSSRTRRRDWASRYVLPLVEEFATETLLPSRVQPAQVMQAALLLTLAAAAAFVFGWLWTGVALLILSTPLDLVARRLSALRLRPLSARSRVRALLWPAAAIALLGLGWWEWRHGASWGGLFAAVVTIAFAEAARIERGKTEIPGGIWLFSRRNAVFAFLPFAALGAWTTGIVALSLYAGVSFFLAQYVTHRLRPS